MSKNATKRITCKRVQPNPLFQKWLEELYNEAKKKRSKLEPMLKEALDSLSKYPVPLQSGAECIVLKGFKKKLCILLDERLKVHNYNLGLAHSEETYSTSSSHSSTNCSSPTEIANFANGFQQSKISLPSATSTTATLHNGSPTRTFHSSPENKDMQGNLDTNIVTNSKSHSPAAGQEKDKSIRKKYKPAHRSGAYAILIALLENTNEYSLTKEELISKAQKHSEESFVRRKPNTYYTAWSNISRLVTKGLVTKVRNKEVRYSLSRAGIKLAEELLEDSMKIPTVNDIIFSNVPAISGVPSTSGVPVTSGVPSIIGVPGVPSTSGVQFISYLPSTSGVLNTSEVPSTSGVLPTSGVPFTSVVPSTSGVSSTSGLPYASGAQSTSGVLNISEVPFTSGVITHKDIHILNEGTITSQNTNYTVNELPAGSFNIILLIDKNETGGVSRKNDPTVAQFNKYPDLNHEYRSLKVGDYMWIARHKVNKEIELALPYIIERKRMDDLGASIKDSRFHEQKFRLRKCGLKNVIYLIENYGTNKHVGLPIQHLMQALANTRVQDGFKVHITDSLTNTARFLAMMTKRLTIRYKDKNLKGCGDGAVEDYLMTFDYFIKTSAKSKPLTVTETFIKLLLQLKGVSVEKALAITSKYSTPRSLIVQYRKCDPSEGEYLLASLKYGNLSRNVGPTVSKSIYQLFTR